MPTFEQAFADVERAAIDLDRAQKELTKRANALKKAARVGNIAAIRRAGDSLAAALDVVRQQTANAADAWTLSDEDVRDYLQDSYVGELQQAAEARGLPVFELHGRLIVHPSEVRVSASDRAVVISRKQSADIRPTWVVEKLAKQRSRSGLNPQQFLESLHKVYLELTRDQMRDGWPAHSGGPVVQLQRVYDLITALPGQAREYANLDFARDLHALGSSDVTQTRNGAKVSFTASTGTRASRGVFTYVDEAGRPVLYYGIRFMGA